MMIKKNDNMKIDIIICGLLGLILGALIVKVSNQEPQKATEPKELSVTVSSYGKTKLIDSVIRHIKQYETFVQCQKPGPSGAILIGYGHLIKKNEYFSECIGEKAADSLLRVDFRNCLKEAIWKNPKECIGDAKKAIAIGLLYYNMKWNSVNDLISRGGLKNKDIWLQYCHYTDKNGITHKSSGLYERRLFDSGLFFN